MESKLLKYGLIVICAAVHIFAPFNIAEGRTRWRYIIAYTVEAVEDGVRPFFHFLLYFILVFKSYRNEIFIYLFRIFQIMLIMILNCTEFRCPYKDVIAYSILSSFVLGIVIMVIYYCRFHPNHGKSLTEKVLADDFLESVEPFSVDFSIFGKRFFDELRYVDSDSN